MLYRTLLRTLRKLLNVSVQPENEIHQTNINVVGVNYMFRLNSLQLI